MVQNTPEVLHTSHHLHNKTAALGIRNQIIITIMAIFLNSRATS